MPTADDQRLLAPLERPLEGAVLDLDGDVRHRTRRRRARRGTRPSGRPPGRAAWACARASDRRGRRGRRAPCGRSGRPWHGRGPAGRGTRPGGRCSRSAARRSATGRSSGRSSGSGMSANILRQMAGVVARFLPPGHSSAVNSIGQFSIPIRTPRDSACATIGRQTSRNLGQFASTDSAGSRPTNELTTPIPSSAAASITRWRWPIGQVRLGPVGRERVRVVAQARDRDPVLPGQVVDALDRFRARGSVTSRCVTPA